MIHVPLRLNHIYVLPRPSAFRTPLINAQCRSMPIKIVLLIPMPIKKINVDQIVGTLIDRRESCTLYIMNLSLFYSFLIWQSLKLIFHWAEPKLNTSSLTIIRLVSLGSITLEPRQTKHSLMSWVGVILNQRWRAETAYRQGCPYCKRHFLFWYDNDFLDFFIWNFGFLF